MKRLVLLVLFAASPVVGAENPAINTSVPCNSGQVVFRPIKAEEGIAYVRNLPGAGRLEARDGGSYVVDFGTPDRVNALLADLNAHHRDEVIDRFQYLQCQYALFPQKQ